MPLLSCEDRARRHQKQFSTRICQCLSLRLLTLQNYEKKKCSLLISHQVYGILLPQPEQTKTLLYPSTSLTDVSFTSFVYLKPGYLFRKKHASFAVLSRGLFSDNIHTNASQIVNCNLFMVYEINLMGRK